MYAFNKGVAMGWPWWPKPPLIPSKENFKAKTSYSIYNIQPHRSYVATLIKNTLPTK